MHAAETAAPEPIDRLYAILSGDDAEDRACDAIPDEACSAVPRNYLLNVANGAATKLAEQLASHGLVLPWLMAAIGAPAALIGFLAPIRQVGALLPQLLVAGRIRRAAVRKWFWVGAGSVQAIALLAMIPAVLLLPPVPAGLGVLVLLGVFATAGGIGSVAFQDVTGKTVPRGRRGRMLANRAAIGGALTLAAGLALRLVLGDGRAVAPYLWLVAAAAVLWALGALIFARIDERPGATEGGRNAWAEARRGLLLAGDVPGYRRYLAARGALAAVEVAMPIFALYAHGLFGGRLGSLGVYVLALGLAQVVSSPFWGAFADVSSRQVMAWAGGIGCAAGLMALAVPLLPELLRSAWVYAVVVFTLGVAEAGVRLGRKTYLVDAAPKDDRPLYIAFANSAIGLVTLGLGAVGIVAQAAGAAAAILVLTLLAGVGALLSLGMPEAGRMTARAPSPGGFTGT
ncbi:MAG TPA: MFS transporter [Alphaproteobacteria bacterium]|nr:MFS transporter [Alphaproteobacteria bacterium]